jgi:hypothetical protein
MGAAAVTVKPPVSVALLPSGFVTVMSCGPGGADPLTIRFASIRVEESWRVTVICRDLPRLRDPILGSHDQSFEKGSKQFPQRFLFNLPDALRVNAKGTPHLFKRLLRAIF